MATVRHPSASLVRRLTLASLLANVGILLTGGAVRLTGSGLGCPTWPNCSDDSWVPTSEMGGHGLIEYGNRGLGLVVGALALATLLAVLAARPRRPSLVRLAAAVLAGVAAQGAIGAVTVWTDLNPWIVGAHFLISIGVIAAAYTLWRRTGEPDAPARPTVSRPLRALVWLTVAVASSLVTVGTVVTGSGPHAGDPDVPRNGLDPAVISQAHSDLAFLLLGLAVAAVFALRAAGAGRPATTLVAVILAQGAVGIVQYYTGLPEMLVWLHMLGSCLVWLAVLDLQHTTRVRDATSPTAGEMPVPERDGQARTQRDAIAI